MFYLYIAFKIGNYGENGVLKYTIRSTSGILRHCQESTKWFWRWHRATPVVKAFPIVTILYFCIHTVYS